LDKKERPSSKGLLQDSKKLSNDDRKKARGLHHVAHIAGTKIKRSS
jgi:hypothetical protein